MADRNCAAPDRWNVRTGASFSAESGVEPIPLEELLLRHAVGMPGADAPRERSASGVMMIPVPKSGTFEKIEGEEEARNVPGIAGLEITARLHDYVSAWPEGSSYLGFLFARGDEPAEVETAIRNAHSKLRFTLIPRLPVEHPVTGKISAFVSPSLIPWPSALRTLPAILRLRRRRIAPFVRP